MRNLPAIAIFLLFGIIHSCQSNNNSKKSIINESSLGKKDTIINPPTQEKTAPTEPKKKLFSCTDVAARFSNETKEAAEELLGKPDKSYSNDYWFFLVWYDKVEDDFDNGKSKHLGMKFPTVFNNERPVIECINHGGVFHMGTSYLRLP